MTAPLIVHPTDFGEASLAAFHHALRLSIALGARLDILHVYASRDEPDETVWHGFPGVRATLVDWRLVAADTQPEDIAPRLGIRVRKTQIAAADTAAAIARYVDDHAAGWVVLATAGRDGVPGWLRPSLAGRVARAVSACTLFVPRQAHGFVDAVSGSVTLDRVLVPVDHRPRPEPALAVAVRLVEALGLPAATVDMLHVADGHGDAPHVVPPETTKVTFLPTRAQGPVADTIVSQAHRLGARIVVMPTAGRHGLFEGLFGSTTEQVVRHVDAPVLAVPAGA
ncbi:MAG: universal stress protein [Alphaproteobacteria bacterium]